MKYRKDSSDIFDDDFEVTYEEIEPEYDEPESFPSRRRRRYPDRQSTRDDFYDPDPEDTGIIEMEKESRRKQRRSVPLAAPIRKGGRVLSRLTAALVRSLTAVLILAVAVYVTYTFWRASAPYGDIAEAFRTREFSMSLASYLCVAAVFLLFEFISLLWSMTKVRVRDGRESWYEDTGRGLFSFIVVFLSSYLAFLLSRFLPETPEFLYGLKGALDVYGSMHNVLFGLCAAGAVSCLVRRYFS